MSERRWVRLLGDGCVYNGPCQLHCLILQIDAANDTSKVYDGVDLIMGKLFVELQTSVDITRELCMGDGVPFKTGIYIDATDEAVATTVVFTPL